MDADNKASKLHPLVAAAAIALILACLTGIAAMMGLLPNFSKSPPPPAFTTSTIGATAPVSTPAATAPPVVAAAPEPAPTPAPPPAPKAAPKKPVKKPTNTASPGKNTYRDDQYRQTPPSCSNCGVVESVRAIEQEGSGSGLGAGIGAVVGGLLGNQVGGGNGRTLATIAGAVGGGYAGNVIEKRRSTTTSYEVIVRMNNGDRQRFIMQEQRWRSGDLVRVDDGNLSAR